MTVTEYVDLKQGLQDKIHDLIKIYEQQCGVIVTKINIKKDTFRNRNDACVDEDFKIIIKDEFVK